MCQPDYSLWLAEWHLNGNNSSYAEGDVVPFRLAIEGLTAGSHTIHINYDFTAGATRRTTFSRRIMPPRWKQKQHFDSWPAPYTPSTMLNSVFSNTGKPANMTLLQALSFKGGSTIDGAKSILLRAAVAALLNSASPNVDYPLTTVEVISKVDAALATNDRSAILMLASQLDAFNNLGCPLN